MQSERAVETVVVACLLLVGGLFFVGAVGMSDTIPEEYRSASPGFGWAWDFDYASGMAEAGRFGEAPWPWPARASGGRLLLTLDQSLDTGGLRLIYQGMPASDRFQLDVGIARLDRKVSYPQEFSVSEARRGLTIDDRRFVLERITPLYLRLRAVDG